MFPTTLTKTDTRITLNFWRLCSHFADTYIKLQFIFTIDIKYALMHLTTVMISLKENAVCSAYNVHFKMFEKTNIHKCCCTTIFDFDLN